MPIRLQAGGAYLSDMRTLRGQIEANGPRATALPVTISHPASPDGFDLYLNLAYEPDSSLPRPAASLNVLGFRNAKGAWHFKAPGICSLPAALIPGGYDGSYAGFGHEHELPPLSNGDLGSDVAALAAYAGEPIAQSLQDSLVRMIVVVSEAARFYSVTAGVNSVLVNEGSFRPKLSTLRAWSGHTLGS